MFSHVSRRMPHAALLLFFLWLGAASQPAAAPRQGPAAEAYRAGNEALRAKRFADAVAALERAAELAPRDADCWSKLGLAYGGLQHWDRAVSAFTRALEIDPHHAKAQNNLANVHFRRGNFEAAAEAYRKAVEIKPDYVLALYHWGWVLRELNRPEESARAFERCLSLEPKNPDQEGRQLDCLFYLGALRYRTGEHQAAAAMMEQVLAAQPDHTEAHYYLGMAYRRLGRLEDAKQQLKIHQEALRAQRRAEPVEKQDDP